MIRIDINEILKRTGLKSTFLAKELFPGNNYSSSALARISKGEANLDSEQIVRLSEVTGIAISDLFSGNYERWGMHSKDRTCYFSKGSYRAEYDMQKQLLSLFHEDTLFTEKYFMPKSLLSLDEVIENLERNIAICEHVKK